MEEQLPQDSVITRGQSIFIASASIISAATTFAVTWLSSRVLSVDDNKEFLVFWSLMSLVFATLLGVQQEAARLIGSQQDAVSNNKPGGARPLVVALGVGVLCAVVLALASPYLMNYVLSVNTGRSMLLVLIGTVAYALHVYFIGAMAGLKAWTLYGLLISTGGIFTLAASGIASLFSKDVFFFQLAFTATAFLWLVFLAFSPTARSAARIRVAEPASVVFKAMLWTLLTALAMAAVSTGFPVFLEATSSTSATEKAALLSAIILGISITRAPIMIPLQAFQGVAISHFLAHQNQPVKALLKPVAVFIGIGVVGAGAAFLLGPWLFDLIYPKYAGQLSGAVLAVLTFAGALLALTTLSGTVALALNKHRLYLAGWVVALLVSLVCLVVGTDLVAKANIALIAGPLAGFAVHLAGIAKRRG
ncbi:hypothetical protein [Rothia sp. ZJ1223]|uniref:hypothetical protein n=1 Tax=Rothia sp. ZJ1223 TaxID=2811098 RepID=UPI0019568EB2|nr:hypothetical protein [Rothia sp. ZJ1223]MBM7051750.1 hypothetical protein [Rothia sp. ZJ1223]